MGFATDPGAARHHGATMMRNILPMTKFDDLRRAMRDELPQSRREIRAARTRARALSPARILMSLLSLPIVAGGVGVSLYVRTSPYEAPDALAHLVARTGCDAARSIGLAPAFRGELGYHAKNDSDGDGVACERVGFDARQVQDVAISPPTPQPGSSMRIVGGAKFVKP